MKTLVVYDSLYGNTEAVAKKIATALKGKVLHVDKAGINNIKNLDLLIIGSPTQGGRPTQKISAFVNQIPSELTKKHKFASFDTRLDIKNLGFLLKILVKSIGYASVKISDTLRVKGGDMVSEPEGFIVNDKEGPLKKGELDRASVWANKITTPTY